MIDIRLERLVTLREAATFCPARRRWKKPHPTTLFRWARNGLHGVRLEVVRVGGTTCTSVEALQRFFERLEAAARVAESGEVVTRPASSISARVDAELDELGL